MQRQGWSDRIRELAKKKYVDAARKDGRESFSISVRSVLGDLASVNFPLGHVPQVCSSLQGNKFLDENNLEIERIEGPPSKQSTTVVVHYRVRQRASGNADTVQTAARSEESPANRAMRLTGKLRGLLKEELAEYGGGEAFLKWIRSEDEDAA